jgi:hypothetical protein
MYNQIFLITHLIGFIKYFDSPGIETIMIELRIISE